jgi:RNA polymerase-binding transcription factor DksA
MTKWKWQDWKMENHGRKCSKCGEPIPVDRLKAQPDATLCVVCKTEIERQPPKPPTRENPETVKRKRRRRFKRINPEELS